MTGHAHRERGGGEREKREIALTMLVTGPVPGNTLATDRGNPKPPSGEVMAHLRSNQSHRVHLWVGWVNISIDGLWMRQHLYDLSFPQMQQASKCIGKATQTVFRGFSILNA